VKKVPLSEVKDDLSRYLREAEDQEVIITRHTANCTNWTIADGTASGWAGIVNVTGRFMSQSLFWANDMTPCNGPEFVYCLEIEFRATRATTRS